MEIDIFGNYICHRPVGKEAIYYFEKYNELLEKNTSHSSTFYIELYKLKKENKNLKEQLDKQKISIYKILLKQFILQAESFKDNKKKIYKYFNNIDKSWYIIRKDVYGKYWLYIYKYNKWISENDLK